MIKVTKQQRENLIYAKDVLWPSIKPQQVAKSLFDYECGSTACFGGWVAKSEYFKEVHVGHSGCPILGEKNGSEVAKELFGVSALFAVRRNFDRLACPELGCDTPVETDQEVTDHQVVANRLEWVFNNSKVFE